MTSQSESGNGWMQRSSSPGFVTRVSGKEVDRYRDPAAGRELAQVGQLTFDPQRHLGNRIVNSHVVDLKSDISKK